MKVCINEKMVININDDEINFQGCCNLGSDGGVIFTKGFDCVNIPGAKKTTGNIQRPF